MIGIQEYSPTCRGLVLPGAFVNVPAGANYDVFDQTKAPLKNLQYCRIQNIGANTILVNLNDTATGAEFVAILAKDTAAGAGNGGVIEIPGSWNVTKINVFNPAGGTDIAVILVLSGNNQRVIN